YAASYASSFSPEIAGRFVFVAPVSRRLRVTVARRMLDHPSTLDSDTVLRLAVQALAQPSRLRRAGYSALVPLGRVEAWIDESADGVWTLAFFTRPTWRRTAVMPVRPELDWDALATRATAIAERRDSTNPFGFPDDVFRKMMQQRNNVRLQTALATYRA